MRRVLRLGVTFLTARGAPPPLARAAALEDSLSSRGPQAPPRRGTPPQRGCRAGGPGMAAGAIVALVLVLVGSACGDDIPNVNTPTPTPVSPATETFSSGVVPMGTAARSFVAAKAGPVEITLVSIGPPTNVTVGMGIGIPTPTASAGCSLNMALNTAPGTTPQITAQVDGGSFCVKVFDVGNLTQEAFFQITIVRP